MLTTILVHQLENTLSSWGILLKHCKQVAILEKENKD